MEIKLRGPEFWRKALKLKKKHIAYLLMEAYNYIEATDTALTEKFGIENAHEIHREAIQLLTEEYLKRMGATEEEIKQSIAHVEHEALEDEWAKIRQEGENVNR